MSPAAATLTSADSPPAWQGTAGQMPNGRFDDLRATLKKAAVALRDSGVEFMLGGGLAVWARGGAESDHDLDLMVKPDDADKALDVLAEAGMRPERPPEGWLYKAWDENDVLVDLIYKPAGLPVTDEALARADEIEIDALPMRVMALEDVLVTKLLALDEQSLDYQSLLQVARPVREQVDWQDVRGRTAGSPYAAAFFTLVEELGILSPRRG
jgi:predicted nucleotidyltransferase